MAGTLAIMLAATTYGTWLRGDRRGWVEKGRILPPAPDLEARDRRRMKYPPYTFPVDQLHAIGEALGSALCDRLSVRLGAMTVQTWHVHVLIGATSHPTGQVVKCLKEAARYHVRPGRPIWTDGYDQRFCFDADTVARRIRYIKRHNEQRGWSARPWAFIESMM